MREVTRARPTPPQRAVPFQSGISDKACIRHAQLHFAPTGSASLCPQVLRSPGPRLTVPTSMSPLRAGLVFQSLPAHVLTSSFFFLYFSNTKLLSFYTPFFLTRDCGCQGEINGRGDCFHIHMNVKVEEKWKIKYNIIFQNLSNWLDQPHHRQ